MACAMGIVSVFAQNISQIADSDPLIITGSIGTNNTYYHTTGGSGYMSPLSNSIFATSTLTFTGSRCLFRYISPTIT